MFFTESQFESYRKLGQHVADSAFGTERYFEKLPNGDLRTWSDIRQSIRRIEERWTAPAQAKQGAFSQHAAALNRLWLQLQEEPDLAFLVGEFFP